MWVEIVRVNAQGTTVLKTEIAPGGTAADALAAAGVTLAETDGLTLWGRRIRPETALTDGARLEVAAALICDPKKVRSERALAQGDVRCVTCGRHGGKRRIGNVAQNEDPAL